MTKNKYIRNVINHQNGEPSKKARKAQDIILLTILNLAIITFIDWTYTDLAKASVVRVENPSWDARAKQAQVAQEVASIEVTSEKENGVLAKGVEEKIKEAFGADADIALAVAFAESGLNPKAIGDGHLKFEHKGELIGQSCGVFQIRILPGRPSCEEMQDVDKNIAFAKKLHQKSGFQPWTAYTKGTYEKYLK